MDGTADVLLVNRRAKNPLNKLAGIRVVIELKKKVDSSHFAQALGQLASCSLKAPLHCYPVSLLTDLNDHWHFSWFTEERIVAQVTLNYPKNAIDFIVATVSEREGSIPFRVPFIAPPLKKLKVDDFLPMPSDGADEMMERYELMADELEPEFLTERRMEYAQHLVQSMPMTKTKKEDLTIEEVYSSDPSYCRWLSHQNRFTDLENDPIAQFLHTKFGNDDGSFMMTWDKYKNRTIKQIQTIDPNYLDWLSKNDFVKTKHPKLKAEVDVLLS
ncbi:unnamed protein product [Phytophthora lilii]|uniref:Unnamed protein product n=1 Tax=Phytophthora lilii TaxID=2077276 RepID=A0A9W6TTS9_9STRA|nr:unnamed protein product [Phytophthora lilii]